MNLKRNTVLVLIAVLVVTFVGAIEAQYCNDDPCRNTNGVVCSNCSYWTYDPNLGWCLVQFIYCVHCGTGEWIYENFDYIWCDFLAE